MKSAATEGCRGGTGVCRGSFPGWAASACCLLTGSLKEDLVTSAGR